MLKAVVLDAAEKDTPVLETVTGLLNRSFEVTRFRPDQLEILPCRSCGSCGHRTPGLCVIKDDMQSVMRSLALSDVIVIITPVRFGGYPYELKKVIDRFMPIGLPLYMVRKGKLLHPMRYREKTFLDIGFLDGPDKEQEDNFRLLTQNNAVNFQFIHRTLVYLSSEDEKAVEESFNKALREVKVL